MKNHIVIKFNKEAIQSRTNEALVLKAFATQDNFLNQFTYRSIVTDEMLSPQQKNINAVNFENLVGICYVQGLDEMSVEEKEILSKKMNAYDIVEYAAVRILQEPVLPIPKVDNRKIPVYGAEDKIPDFTDLQGYKDGIEDGHIGIDMEYAWSIGIAGQGIQAASVENGFNFKHINLKRKNFIDHTDVDAVDNNDHGAATSGIVYAKDMGSGVKGLVYDLDFYYGVSTGRTAESLAICLSLLKKGDILHTSLGEAVGPIDHLRESWEVVREGVKAGILVIMAAGNSNLDLDKDPIFEKFRSWPDNGAIRVGAGGPGGDGGAPSLTRLNFSNMGSYVHLHGWGERIATTGYGDLYDDGPNRKYTYYFNGTSAATPIVASAAIAVQSWYKEQTGDVLTPREMRDLLIETGIPQRKAKWESRMGHIGPLPNVRNAIGALEARLQLK